MCITRKTVKNNTELDPAGAKPKKKVLLKKKAAKSGSTESKSTVSPAVAELASQLEQEKRTVDETPVDGTADKVDKEKEKEPAKSGDKRPGPKRPSADANPHNSLSGVRGNTGAKKKARNFKWGQVDRDELSINNEMSEYLENAQLTKLMSHADVKALMNNQNAPGADAEENSCRDTVEEVDSEMEEMAFPPLLAPIVQEEEKGFGLLPHPQEAKKADGGGQNDTKKMDVVI
ncbi:unnamed protein product [Caenorhabditis sp. 36 PRJEB53466]|nr:unnamed protein product [Caenorhabditis sp. 36 PRJEB53466]